MSYKRCVATDTKSPSLDNGADPPVYQPRTSIEISPADDATKSAVRPATITRLTAVSPKRTDSTGRPATDQVPTPPRARAVTTTASTSAGTTDDKSKLAVPPATAVVVALAIEGAAT